MPGLNYAGWAREAIVTTPTWPSASPALVTHLLPFLTLAPSQGIHKQFVADTHGPVGFSGADVVDISPRFAGTLALRYGGFDALFVAALGLEAKRVGVTVMPELLATGVYRHVYEVDPVLSTMAPWQVTADGIQGGDIASGQRKVRRGTLAAFREFGAWELQSCMLDQMSLNWQADTDVATMSVEGLAYSRTFSSLVNTPTTLRRAKPNVYADVQCSHGRIRLAPYSTVTPLNSSHRIACASANVTLQNQLETAPGPRTGLYSEEPERARAPIVLGSLLKPRYASNALLTAWEANTRYMMDLKFTGPRIAGTAYHYQLNVYVPGLFFTQVEPSDLSPAVSSQPMQWFAATPDVAPAGFPTTARLVPLIIETVNNVAAHSLL